MIKLITIYSDTHKSLLDDYFIPSVNSIGEYELECVKIEQVAQGDYDKHNFKEAMMQKMIIIKNSIVDNWGDVILYSDCDIIFKDRTADLLLELLKDNDALFQRDDEDLCAGFIFMKCNQKMLDFMTICIDNYFNEVVHDDQDMMRLYIHKIKHELMPDYISNLSIIRGTKIWNGEKIEIPKDIKVFHANWTIGIENKKKLLQIAQK